MKTRKEKERKECSQPDRVAKNQHGMKKKKVGEGGTLGTRTAR